MNQDERGYFEDFLQERTAEFRMRPHANVWKSIYNNCHPNRKWPAISTLLLFVCAFLLLGEFSVTSTPNNLKTQTDQIALADQVPHEDKQTTKYKAKVHYPAVAINYPSEKPKPRVRDEEPANVDKLDIEQKPYFKIDMNLSTAVHQSIDNNEMEENHFQQISTANVPFDGPTSTKFVTKTNPEKEIKFPTTDDDQSTFSYQVYATPSYGYHSIGMNQDKNAGDAILSHTPMENATGNTAKRNLGQISTWNIEAGGALLWSINSMIRLKAGMQVNYSSFSHDESETNALMNKTNAKNYTDISSNSSYQISMPMGTEFELAGNKVFQWYAGATIQPSYLFGTNAIAIHSDLKSIMQDPSLLRRWNVNTSFETYMSYKMKNGLIINAGPQFRYQLFSSFDRSLLYTEKLYNLGMKLGITKGF